MFIGTQIDCVPVSDMYQYVCMHACMFVSRYALGYICMYICHGMFLQPPFPLCNEVVTRAVALVSHSKQLPLLG